MRWKSFSSKKLAILICLLSLFFNGCGEQTPSSPKSTKSSQNQSLIQKKEKTLQQKGLEDRSVPTEYRNALKKGIRYVETQHMSKGRVYMQLTSPYDKFSEKAAQWAVSHMSDIDWKKHALYKAKSYQKNMNMSNARIFQQLSSPYGERFTEEEARYAVDHLD